MIFGGNLNSICTRQWTSEDGISRRTTFSSVQMSISSKKRSKECQTMAQCDLNEKNMKTVLRTLQRLMRAIHSLNFTVHTHNSVELLSTNNSNVKTHMARALCREIIALKLVKRKLEAKSKLKE
jgi:hypothetical protein